MGKKKPKHHIIPKKYLRGFCDEESHVWVFRRSMSYQPSFKKGRGNPYRSGVGVTAFEKNRNTVKTPEGTLGFFENKLQIIEIKADDFFRKVGARESITLDDKEKLARYIGLMIKRVDKRKEIFDPLFNNLLHFESSKYVSAARELAEQGRFRAAFDRLRVKEYLHSQDLRKYIYIKSAIEPYENMHKALMEMRWEFVMTPSGKNFVTSDTPVVYNTHFGLKRSPLLFPIDQRTALIATWNGERDLAYIDGSIEQLLKINGIIIAQATKEVYANTPDQWIHQVLENGVVITD